MKPLKNVVKFMKTVGLLELLLIELFRALRKWVMAKLFSPNDEPSMREELLLTIEEQVKLITKEVTENQYSPEVIDSAISAAMLHEKIQHSDLPEDSNLFQVLGVMQTALLDAYHPGEEINDADSFKVISDRLKNKIINLYDLNPKLLTPKNLLDASDFITKKAIANYAWIYEAEQELALNKSALASTPKKPISAELPVSEIQSPLMPEDPVAKTQHAIVHINNPLRTLESDILAELEQKAQARKKLVQKVTDELIETTASQQPKDFTAPIEPSASSSELQKLLAKTEHHLESKLPKVMPEDSIAKNQHANVHINNPLRTLESDILAELEQKAEARKKLLQKVTDELIETTATALQQPKDLKAASDATTLFFCEPASLNNLPALPDAPRAKL